MTTKPNNEPRPLAMLTAVPLPLVGLRISGADACRFLQGQSTCDVASLEPGHGTHGAFCNPQGRVIATFILVREGQEDYLLWLAENLAETVSKRLRMYVLRAEVDIQAAGIAAIGLWGPVRARLPEAPLKNGTLVHIEGNGWLRVPGSQPRWLVSGPLERLQALQESLVGDTLFQPSAAWTLQDIRCGIATVTRATSEKFLPQMLNLDRIGAVSFDKGCYTGQEVIARSHYRGQVKRRLYRLRGTLRHTPAPGEALRIRDETVGQVVNAASENDSQEFLAVVRCDRAHESEVRLESALGSPLQWLTLDYTCL